MTETVPFFDLQSLVHQNKYQLMNSIESVIDGGQYIGGAAVSSFEKDFASYLGADHFVGVGNGLDAIRLALEVLEIGQGDEVIVPSFSFYATWLAVLQVGATPVFADVEIESANLDCERVVPLITSKTKAVIVVHLFGRPANIVQLSEIADNYGIHLIEDCAQSHGAEVDGKKIGTFGTIGAFSFYPTKNLGALGDAGGLSVSDPKLAEKLESRRSYGQGKTKYEHIDTGWNTRLDPIQAVVLTANLSRLDKWNELRVDIASKYLSALTNKGFGNFAPQHVTESVWHHFVLSSQSREVTRAIFEQQGVKTDIHYPYSASSLGPLAPYVRNQLNQEFMNAEKLSKEVFSLPIGPWMNDDQISKVCRVLSNLSG